MSQEGAPVRAYLWGWSHDVCKSVFVGCDADVETVRGGLSVEGSSRPWRKKKADALSGRENKPHILGTCARLKQDIQCSESQSQRERERERENQGLRFRVTGIGFLLGAGAKASERRHQPRARNCRTATAGCPKTHHTHSAGNGAKHRLSTLETLRSSKTPIPEKCNEEGMKVLTRLGVGHQEKKELACNRSVAGVGGV